MVKIFKRIIEEVTRPYFIHIVNGSFREPNGKSHQIIKLWASKWYGINKVGNIERLFSKWFIDYLVQAFIGLPHHEKHDDYIGDAVIGFEDLKIICKKSDLNSSLVYLFGFSDNKTVFEIYQKNIPTDSIAIDVGSNLGIHTVVMASCVGKTGRVITFEPLQPIYERLSKNIKKNKLSNVDIFDKGISSKNTTLKFDPMLYEKNIGKGKISDEGTIEIDVACLDDAIKEYNLPVSIIKLDIEGHELEAIKGAQQVLKRYEPYIICEVNQDKYSFKEFKESIPYSADYYKVPLTYYDRLEKNNCFSGDHFDVLVVPNSKKHIFKP